MNLIGYDVTTTQRTATGIYVVRGPGVARRAGARPAGSGNRCKARFPLDRRADRAPETGRSVSGSAAERVVDVSRVSVFFFAVAKNVTAGSDV